MHTEIDTAPAKSTSRSGRWAKLFGGYRDRVSREDLEREAAAEIGALERPIAESEQAVEVTPVEAEATADGPLDDPIEASEPAGHRPVNAWSRRFREILSDEPAEVRRERLEREAAEELRLNR